jgi:hypothetical protein
MPATTPALRLHVTARPAIDSEPPYERDVAPDDGGPRVLGSLALAVAVHPQDAAPKRPAATSMRGALTLAPPLSTPAADPDPDEVFDVIRTSRAALPAPGPRAGVLVGAITEALSGRRPLGQLIRWVTSDVYDELEVSVARDRGRGWSARTRRLIVTEPADGVAEVTAVVQRGVRASALALRMEGRDGRWVVTALQLA